MLIAQLYPNTYENPAAINQEFEQLYTFLNGNLDLTNLGLSFSAGAVVYSTATGVSLTGVGTSGMAFLSQGASTPTWGTLGLTYGGTNNDLSGIAIGSLIARSNTTLIGLTPGTAGLPVLSGGSGSPHTYGILSLAAGGLGVDGTTLVGGQLLVISGTSFANITNATNGAMMYMASGAPAFESTTKLVGGILVPDVTGTRDIGTSSLKFGTVWANTFSGTFSGTFGDGTQAAPGIAWTNETGMGFWRETSGKTSFAISNTKIFHITTSGIWTSLDVTGATLGGTLSTASQTNVTQLGSLVHLDITGDSNGFFSIGGSQNVDAGMNCTASVGHTSATSEYGINLDFTMIGGSTTVYGIMFGMNLVANKSVTNWYQLYVDNPFKNSGSSITNAYGIYMPAITAGGTLNAALWTNGGQHVLGDVVGIGGSSSSTIALYVSLASMTKGASFDPGWTAGLTNAYGVQIAGHDAGSGTISNMYSLYITNPTATGTVSKQYGLYIESLSNATASNKYAIYTNDGNVRLGAANIVTGTLQVGVNVAGSSSDGDHDVMFLGSNESSLPIALVFGIHSNPTSGSRFGYMNSTLYGSGFAKLQINDWFVLDGYTLTMSSLSNADVVVNGAPGSGNFIFQRGGTTKITIANALTTFADNISCGTVNGQTISSAASFTGTMQITSTLTVGAYDDYAIKFRDSGGNAVPGIATTGGYTKIYSNNSSGGVSFRNRGNTSDVFSVTDGGNGTFVGTLTVSGTSNAIAGLLAVGNASTSAGAITIASNGVEAYLGLKTQTSQQWYITGGVSGVSDNYLSISHNANGSSPLVQIINSSGNATFAGTLTVSGAFINLYNTTGNQLIIGYNSSNRFLWDVSSTGVNKISISNDFFISGGNLKMDTIGAFASGDKYLVVDANGYVHKSAVGPAS